MKFIDFIFQDWKANKNNTKGRFVLFLFRIANFSRESRFYYYLALPYRAFYTFFVEWMLGIDLPWQTQIGKSFKIYHGQSLVINKKTIIGDNCIVRHSTTIGNKQLKDGSFSMAPIIKNGVDVGSNVCIIGEITIGNNVKIGCGSVVVKDIQNNCTAVGNPAVVLQKSNSFKLNPIKVQI